MFLHHEHDPAGPLLIPQTSHAWLAWQLAEHWGNRRLARPAPRAEVLAAVMLHDAGWTEFDRTPDVDGAGRPVTFDRMPVATHLKLWRHSVDRAELHSRYAALLVAAHFERLAAHKASDLEARGLAEQGVEVAGYRETMAARAEAWRRGLECDARYRSFLAGAGWRTAAHVLAACDRISVYLCAGVEGPFTAQALDPAGEAVTLHFRPVGERVWRVSPWPLRGARLEVHGEGWRLPGAAFADSGALRATVAAAPVERLGFTLLRPSAPVDNAR